MKNEINVSRKCSATFLKFKSWTPFSTQKPSPAQALRSAGVNLTGHYWIGMVPECAKKDGAFLIYCRTSGRAALSAVQLQKLGYTNVISMNGGFEVWNNEQRPTEKPEPVNFE